MGDRHGVRRRIMLLSAIALAGCATAPAGPVLKSTATATATRKPTPRPTATPPTPAVEPPRRPTRDEILERYAGRTHHEWGTEVAGVVSGLADVEVAREGLAPHVALTFDACGGPGGGDGYDADLIDVLRQHQVAATLFLNARWIAARPALAAELAADPLFALACHGNRHVPLSVSGRDAYGIVGTGSVGEVYDELTGNVEWFIEHTGQPPRYSRPGTAHCDEVAAAIAQDLEMPVAGFTVNGDGGATFSVAMVRDTLDQVRDGDIVLAHLNRPGGGTAEGCAAALPGLLDRGVRFVAL